MDLLDTAFDSQLAVNDDDAAAQPELEGAAANADYTSDEDTTQSSEATSEAKAEATVSLTIDSEGVGVHEACSDASDSGEEDGLSDSLDNHEKRPFRDDPEHINAHIMKNILRGRNAESICSASTVTSVAPEVIRERVKKQFKSQERIRQARRIRKHGEAAIQTKQRRDNRYDVETSLDAGWY